MKPSKLDLPTIWRGCDWGPVTFKWKDADGQPIELARFRARVQSLNINLAAQITYDTHHGIVTLSLDKDETALFRLGVESWDWIWEHLNVNGVLDYRYPPFLSGKIQVKDPVTKAGVDLLLPEIPNGSDSNGSDVGTPPILSIPLP